MSDSGDSVGILGVGYAVPSTVRRNGDPLFKWLFEVAPDGTDLFKGYDERRILGPGETATDLMLEAVKTTLNDAGCAPGDIGMLLGYVSVSDYQNPNGLGRIHQALELPGSTPIIPINNEFNNFTAGMMVARALIRDGMQGNALVACAGNWSRHVDYHTPQSISAADGAGAVVIGPVSGTGAWLLTDSETGVWSKYFGDMYMAGTPVATDYDCDTNPHHCTFTTPYFTITERGKREYGEFGKTGVPEVVNALLKRNGLAGQDIALVTHQSSSVLIEYWREKIQPGAYLETLARYGNMTVANLPVNLACGYEDIEQDGLVVAGIGVEGQVNAVLFQR